MTSSPDVPVSTSAAAVPVIVQPLCASAIEREGAADGCPARSTPHTSAVRATAKERRARVRLGRRSVING